MSNREEYNEENDIESMDQDIESDELAETAKIKKYGSAILGIVVLIVLAFAGLNYMQDKEAKELEEATIKLERVIPLLAQGQYQAALEGGSPQANGQPLVGLRQIADSYSSIEAGKTASFYTAKAMVELGNTNDAISYFQNATSSESDIIKVGSHAGLAMINELKSDWVAAADNYVKASANLNYTVKKTQYLYFAGNSYEKAGNTSKSEEMYRKVLKLNAKNTSDEFSSLSRAGLNRLGMEFEL
ncbi:tetratricopeptide repeat protein [Candidatus Kapabacteria bacterium]|nr:tetratricopeptide repeat protein [Candidatus Kapabacteria bacterium]